MKHTYRDSNGRFAKRPPAVPETITSEKELTDEVLQPVSVHMNLNKSRLGRPKNNCTYMLDYFSKIPETTPRKNPYGLASDVGINSEVNKLLDSEIYEGHPQFLYLGKDEMATVRILGAPVGYEQSFPKFDKVVKRYMLSIYDHSDGQYKVLCGGKQLMQNIHAEMQKVYVPEIVEPKEMTLLELCFNWIKVNVFEIIEEEKPDVIEDKPFDVIIERVCREGNPRLIEYKVERTEVE